MQEAGGGKRDWIQLQLYHFLGQVELCKSFQTYKKKSRGPVWFWDQFLPPHPSCHFSSLVLHYVHWTWVFLQESSLETKVWRKIIHWQVNRLSCQEIQPNTGRGRIWKDWGWGWHAVGAGPGSNHSVYPLHPLQTLSYSHTVPLGRERQNGKDFGVDTRSPPFFQPYTQKHKLVLAIQIQPIWKGCQRGPPQARHACRVHLCSPLIHPEFH